MRSLLCLLTLFFHNIEYYFSCYDLCLCCLGTGIYVYPIGRSDGTLFIEFYSLAVPLKYFSCLEGGYCCDWSLHYALYMIYSIKIYLSLVHTNNICFKFLVEKLRNKFSNLVRDNYLIQSCLPRY